MALFSSYKFRIQFTAYELGYAHKEDLNTFAIAFDEEFGVDSRRGFREDHS